MSVEEVRRLQGAGQPLLFVDTRGRGERESDPFAIPGSLLPRDVPAVLTTGAQVVTYCSCPLEASAAALALDLRKRGWKAAPLRGGWAAWKVANLPQEPIRESVCGRSTPLRPL